MKSYLEAVQFHEYEKTNNEAVILKSLLASHLKNLVDEHTALQLVIIMRSFLRTTYKIRQEDRILK